MRRAAGTAHDRAVERALWIVLGVNVALAAAKLSAARLGHLLALEAEGLHSLADGASTVIALVGLWLARRPADPEHPYGHRRWELIATAAIGLSLGGVAIHLAGDIVDRVIGRAAPTSAATVGPAVFGVLAGTLALNLAVARYQARRAAALASAVLAGDARHARCDAYVTAGVIVSALAAQLSWRGLDLAAAAVIAALIAREAIALLGQSARWLTDGAAIDAGAIRGVVARYQMARALRAVRTRGTPAAAFVELRVAVAPDLSVRDAGALGRALTATLCREFPVVVDVTIQIEPEEHEAAG